MDFLLLLFGLVVISGIVYSLYKEATKPLWAYLASRYESSNLPEMPNHFSNEMVFFWSENEEDLHNAMHVIITEKGLGIKAPLIKPYIKSILIPWGELEIEKIVLKWFRKRLVLNIKGASIKLAISLRHEKDVRSKLAMQSK